MNFDTGKKPPQMGNKTAQKIESSFPQGMPQAVKTKSMETGITKNDLGDTANRRIPVKNRLDIFLNSFKHSPHSWGMAPLLCRKNLR
jgi:siroheme synthase (precorrin-2 oxidase/ferrochelatase)